MTSATRVFAAAYSGQCKLLSSILAEHPQAIGMRHPFENHTPLHMAAEAGRAKAAQVLLEHGAEVDALDTMGRTPLHWAAVNLRPLVAKLLLRYGARTDLTDFDRATPLMLAAHQVNENRIRLVELMVNGGATWDIYSAVWMDAMNVVDRLLDEGHLPNNAHPTNSLPVMLSAVYMLLAKAYDVDPSSKIDIRQLVGSHAAVFRRLVAAGASVNVADDAGFTSLHAAIALIDVEGDLARFLLVLGADPTAKDMMGRTPFDVAIEMKHTAAAKLLSDATSRRQ